MTIQNNANPTQFVQPIPPQSQTAQVAGQVAAGPAPVYQVRWSQILDKPPFGTASLRNVPAAGDASAAEVVLGNDTRLFNARYPTPFPSNLINDAGPTGLQMLQTATPAAGRAVLELGDAATITLPVGVNQGGTGATTAANARSNLGATTVGNALFTTASAAAARTTLGSGVTGDALFLTATAAAARTLLGATAVGDALFTTASAATARTTLGATAIGDALFTTVDAAAARVTLGLGTMATINSPVPIANGGTGSTTAAAARTALGLGTMATINSPVPIANGGTAGTTAAAARANIGAYSVTGGTITGNADVTGTFGVGGAFTLGGDWTLTRTAAGIATMGAGQQLRNPTAPADPADLTNKAYVDSLGGGVMTGATAVSNGAAGLVPQPLAGQQHHLLQGDGTWFAAPRALPIFSDEASGLRLVATVGGTLPLNDMEEAPRIAGLGVAGTMAMAMTADSIVAIGNPDTATTALFTFSSPDGLTWTQRDTSLAKLRIASDGQRIVVFPNTPSVACRYSDDGGVTWSAGGIPGGSIAGAALMLALPGASGSFMAAGTASGSFGYRSTDGGLTWSGTNYPPVAAVEGAAVPGLFVMFPGGTGTTYYTSPTGGTGAAWTARTAPVAMASAANVRIVETVDGAEIYLSDTSTGSIWRCTDGINWELLTVKCPRILVGATWAYRAAWVLNGIPFAVATGTSPPAGVVHAGFSRVITPYVGEAPGDPESRRIYKFKGKYLWPQATGGYINLIDAAAVDATMGLFV